MCNSKQVIAKVLTIIIVLCFYDIDALTQTTQGSFEEYTVDKTVKRKFEKANLKSEFKLSMPFDGFFFFLSKKNDKELFDNATVFFDTLQTFINVPYCDCMIKKDTIYLQGGIVYESGIFFTLKIVNNLFNGEIWITRKKNFRINNSEELVDDIHLSSVNQTLKIQNKGSLKFGKKMIGELLLESENFFVKDDPVPDKLIMKLLFRCKIDDMMFGENAPQRK